MEYIKNNKKNSEKTLFPKKPAKKTAPNIEAAPLSPEIYYKKETEYVLVKKYRV